MIYYFRYRAIQTNCCVNKVITERKYEFLYLRFTNVYLIRIEETHDTYDYLHIYFDYL